MRLRTFLISYAVVASILFALVAAISLYSSQNQLSTLREQSIREYRSLANSLQGNAQIIVTIGDEGLVYHLIHHYVTFYAEQGIELTINPAGNLPNDETEPTVQVSFVEHNQNHIIHANGIVATALQDFYVELSFDVSDTIADLHRAQYALLVFFVIFALVAALALHLVLAKMFRPIEIVTKASKDIADGHFHKRISIDDSGELSSMAQSFNRMAEEVEQRIQTLKDEAQSKQQFIDNFSHELRTPLTAIYGFADFLQKTNLDEKEKIEFAQHIMDEAKYLEKVADSMLLMSTLRNSSPVKEEVSIKQLFASIEKTMQGTLSQRHMKLTTNPTDDYLLGQEDLLKCLLLNLCANSAQACAEEEGLICMEAVKKDEVTILSVADNGCGISSEDIPRLTEAFYQTDKARSRTNAGVGLGLAIASQIAKLHDATLEIKSDYGVGTTVKIIFTSSK